MSTGTLIPYSMTLLSHSHMPTEGGVGSGADHTRMARFQIPHSYPTPGLTCGLGNSQKDKVRTTPEFFFWQPTIGHSARFKVTEEPHGRHAGQEQPVLAQSFTTKPEQVFQKWTTSGRQPLEAGTQGTPENPSLLGFRDSPSWGLFLGHRKATFSGPWGEGCAGPRLGWAGGEEEGRAVLRTPAEADYGRQRAREDGKPHLRGAGWGCSPALLSPIKNESPR